MLSSTCGGKGRLHEIPTFLLAATLVSKAVVIENLLLNIHSPSKALSKSNRYVVNSKPKLYLAFVDLDMFLDIICI